MWRELFTRACFPIEQSRKQGDETNRPTPYTQLQFALGIARAATLTDDAARSRRAYQRFLTLWKEADAGLPVLIQAKKDYELLK
jgi:hypothetical protein